MAITRSGHLVMQTILSAVTGVGLALPRHAAADDLVVSSIQFYDQQHAQSWDDWVRSALENPVVEAAVSAVASYYGAPPGSVKAAKLLLGPRRKAGEDHWVGFDVPEGYVFCNARLAEAQSSIGKGHLGVGGFKGGSHGRKRDYIYMYYWLKKRPVGQGRSLLQIRMEVISVRPDLRAEMVQEGKCLPYQSKIIDANWDGGNFPQGFARRKWDDPTMPYGSFTPLPPA